MDFFIRKIRKYPIASACIILIWTLSLVPFFPHTPLDNVRLIDKWVHILMYGGTFGLLWIEYICKHREPDYEKLAFWAWIAPIAMSGLLELLQEYCTFGHRGGDWLDLAANATGVTLAAIAGMTYYITRYLRKR